MVAALTCMSAHVHGAFDACDNSEREGLLMINPHVQNDHIQLA